MVYNGKSYETGWFGGTPTSPITIILVTGPWSFTRTCCGETSWADDLLASGDTKCWFSWLLHIQWMLVSSIGFNGSFGHVTVHIIPNHRRGCTTSQHHMLSVGKPQTNHRNHQSSWFLSNLRTTSSFKKQHILWLCQNSYWIWPSRNSKFFIKKGGSFHRFLLTFTRPCNPMLQPQRDQPRHQRWRPQRRVTWWSVGWQWRI